MKAIRLHHTRPADVLELEDIPLPKPGPGEALVRIRAAGLNFADIYMRNGSYPAPISLPFTPGLEGAGVAEAVGEGVAEASDDGTSNVKPGDRVSYLALQYGAYADYQIVKANHLIPLPPDISFETAAAITLQGMTAHALVYQNYPVKPGVTVLVHAAAGGNGLLLVQWLKHLGACVIGTVSTEEKAQALARQAPTTRFFTPVMISPPKRKGLQTARAPTTSSTELAKARSQGTSTRSPPEATSPFTAGRAAPLARSFRLR